MNKSFDFLSGLAPICMLVILGIGFIAPSHAAIDLFDFSSDQLQERYQSLTEELRCPKCQNQNLSDSDSPISSDLRREIYLMLEEGRTDQQIKDFLVARYGVFVLYNPPTSGITLWVWLVPIVFTLGGGIFVWRILQQASRRPIEDGDEDDFL